MSKWLFTFGVVTDPFREKALADASRVTDEAPDQVCDSKVKFLENAFTEVLQSIRADDVAYYRVIMDGWNRIHHELTPWIEENYPLSQDDWGAFVDTGVLTVEPCESSLLRMLPAPQPEAIANAVCGLGPGAYAGYAFLYALLDGLSFVQATSCPLYVLGRCVGPSMGDWEYVGGHG